MPSTRVLGDRIHGSAGWHLQADALHAASPRSHQKLLHREAADDQLRLVSPVLQGARQLDPAPQGGRWEFGYAMARKRMKEAMAQQARNKNGMTNVEKTLCCRSFG